MSEPLTAEQVTRAVYRASDGEHETHCIRQRFEAGEPTEGGGYRMKFDGVWYEARPVDRTPKCDCGIDHASAILRRLLDSGFLEAAMRSEAIKNECAERPMYPDEPPQARYDLEGQAAGECSAAYCRLMAQPTEGDHA
jgi:hypothetical protein